MSLEQPTGDVTVRISSATQPRLAGHWLMLARIAWLFLAVAAITVFVATIPPGFDQIRTPCSAAQCLYPQILPQNAQAAGISMEFYAGWIVFTQSLAQLVFIVVGLLIFWRRSDERIALLGSAALLTFGASNNSAFDTILLPSPLLQWLSMLVSYVGGIAFAIFLLTFPDGRFALRWTRWLALAAVVYQLSSFFPNSPLFNGPLALAVLILLIAFTLLAVIQRYRHVSNPDQRQQTKWMVFGVVTGGGGFAILLFVFSTLSSAGAGLNSGNAGSSPLINLVLSPLPSLCMALIPLSIAFSILHSRLWDIDFVINRTLVYGALSAAVVAVYVLVVGVLVAIFQASGSLAIALVGTGVVATIIHPIRERLQRAVNRLLYGDRDDPYTVLARLAQRLEATLLPDAVLPTIVSTVREALKLPYAAITLYQDEALTIAASAGEPVADPVAIPLVYQGKPIGQLLLGERAPGEAFSPADQRLLNDLARQAGIAAHAVRLTANLQRMAVDLQRSRERLVIAREEERRRLRRDLHDDLAPTLAALALGASTIGDVVPTDPPAAIALSAELATAIRATVGNIRRLVYDLRPPTLDELGLVAAVRERAAYYGSPAKSDNGSGSSDPLQVVVEAPDTLPPLPAAVEVAAYRIIQEALANVTRHARASTCIIRFRLGDEFEVEILDDGVGLPAQHPIGVGLPSMRERAAELGGSCRIERRATAGTRIYVCLPVLKEEIDGTAAYPDRR